MIGDHLHSQLVFPTAVGLLLGYMAVQTERRTDLANGQVVVLLYTVFQHSVNSPGGNNMVTLLPAVLRIRQGPRTKSSSHTFNPFPPIMDTYTFW
jgi:hypothetical protein